MLEPCTKWSERYLQRTAPEGRQLDSRKFSDAVTRVVVEVQRPDKVYRDENRLEVRRP